jgi:hypothetical protein
MPTHTKGYEGNLSTGTHIQSLRMSALPMGSQVRQLLATLCVALSLTLFALGGADATGRFCLRTLSCSRLIAIMGLILDIVIVSRAVVGTSCEELGRRVNMGLLRPFTMLGRAPLLCLLGCNSTGL